MLAELEYSAQIQTGTAALLQVATPMTANQMAWTPQRDVAGFHLTWSDRIYRFTFAPPRLQQVSISEAQSQSLHSALIASFDDFVAPISIS